MDFWFYFKYIIDAVLKLMNFKIVLGNVSFTFLAVFIGTTLLGIIFYAVGRLLK